MAIERAAFLRFFRQRERERLLLASAYLAQSALFQDLDRKTLEADARKQFASKEKPAKAPKAAKTPAKKTGKR